jgi:hypothetical protein
MEPSQFQRFLVGHADDEDAVEIDLVDLAAGGGRPWRLKEDPLFPGVPGEVSDPVRWRRLWWLAPRGAGRSLVGRWLAAQREVRFVRARTWADARLEMKRGEPTYLELSSPEEADSLFRADGLEGWPLCVAAPFMPPSAESALGGRGLLPRPSEGPWHVVVSPPSVEWIGAMLSWAASFYPEDRPLDLDRARHSWNKLGGEYVFLTPGDGMAFCGLVSEFGVELANTGVDAVCRAWLRRLTSRVDLPPAGRAWAGGAAWQEIQTLLSEEVVSGVADGSRDHSTWVALGGADLVDRLLELGLLVHEGADRLNLHPRWFWLYSRLHVTNDLARGPRLAEAALRRPALMANRLARFSLTQLAALLPPVDPSDMRSVILTEVIFTAVGWRLIQEGGILALRTDPADRALLERVWAQQGDVAIAVAGLPRPRLGGDAHLLARWFAAALAISRRIPGSATPWPADPERLLDPWGRQAPGNLARVLDEMGSREDSDIPRLVVPLAQSVEELPLTDLTVPALLVADLARAQTPRGDVLARLQPKDAKRTMKTATLWGVVRRLGRASQPDTVAGRCEEAEESTDDGTITRLTAATLWRSWAASLLDKEPIAVALELSKQGTSLAAVTGSLPESIWAEASAVRLLDVLLQVQEIREKPVFLPVITFAAQRAVIGTWTDRPRALAVVDPEVLQAALVEGAVPEEVFPALWEARAEDLLAALATTAATGAMDRAEALLRDVPDTLLARALDGARPVLAALGRRPSAATWAWARIGRRAPGWEQLWGWLDPPRQN